MRVLIVGCGRSDFNYRKIEGFYLSFSKIAEVEWVNSFFDCKHDCYDIIFGEIHLSEICDNIERYQKMKIKVQIIWMTYSIDKLIKLSNLKKDTYFINAYKTDILNKKIISEFINNNNDMGYQICKDEGIYFKDMLNFDFTELPDNLEICYLPCCISIKDDFNDDKVYDICYFGSINNRPGVEKALDILSRKYKIYYNAWDKSVIKSPEECYNIYKLSKVTISEQVHPVILEYPVRLGESTSTGCRLFLIESINCKNESNILIPDYTSCIDSNDLIYKVENYIDNFKLEQSKKLYLNFKSTFDNAVDFLMSKIETRLN